MFHVPVPSKSDRKAHRFVQIPGRDANQRDLCQSQSFHCGMRVVEIQPLVTNAGDVAREYEGVVEVGGALDEVEFGDEGVFDPVAD